MRSQQGVLVDPRHLRGIAGLEEIIMCSYTRITVGVVS